MKPYHLILLIITLLLMLACAGTPAEQKIVTVSIEPQKYMLEQITGDRIQVRCLLSDGANPETYDPSMTHMLNLQKSEAYLRMGNIGFEAALIDKIHDSHPDLKIFNTSLGIAPLTGTHGHAGHTPHEGPEAVDPHTWTSVKNARVIASNMLEAMTVIDPANKDYYRRNYERFAAHLDSLDRAIAARLAPMAGKAFMVWHPSMSYFARDYGLEQVVIGGHESKESSIGGMKSAIDHARELDARVFFAQPDMDSRQVSAINSEIGAQEVSVNPLSYHWEEEILKMADALAGSQTE